MKNKMKEMLLERAGKSSVIITESTYEYVHPFDNGTESVPVVTAHYADGTVEELRLYDDPNSLWLAVEPNDKVQSLELYCGIADDPEYIGSWNVINGKIQY